MKKIWRLIKVQWLRVRTFFLVKKYGQPRVMNSLDTIRCILDTNLSVSRYGDGEFDIMRGKSIKFQDYDARLKTRLKEIAKNSNKNLIVGIPDIYSKETRKILSFDSKFFWLRYINKNHANIIGYLDLGTIYYDACVTRPYIRYDKKNICVSEEIFSGFKKIWNDKDIIIVEGEYSRLGVNNDLFANVKSIKRILCPSKNAYSKYNEILNSIKKNANNELILISLGPTATILAADLVDCGIRAIDLGHIDLEYDWYNMKGSKRMQIQDKLINELENNEEVSTLENIKDEKYKNSIIDIIR